MDKAKNEPDHYFTAHPKSKPSFGMIRTRLRGKQFEFLTASGVFSRDRIDLGTRLLIESMVLPRQGYVLDVGCGYGAIGIVTAATNDSLRVVMVDVNARAIWLTKQNIKKNNINCAEVRRGNLYESVGDLRFSCVLSNPPVSAGMAIVEKIIAEAPQHMNNKATLQIVVRSKIGGKRLRFVFEKAFDDVQVLARESGYRVLIAEKQ